MRIGMTPGRARRRVVHRSGGSGGHAHSADGIQGFGTVIRHAPAGAVPLLRIAVIQSPQLAALVTAPCFPATAHPGGLLATPRAVALPAVMAPAQVEELLA